MKKIFYIIVFIVLPVLQLLSQTTVEISTEKVIIDGKKFYMHTVAQGNTMYSICKAYGIQESDLTSANPEINAQQLKLGEVLKIPVLNELSADGKHIIYTVKPGDTLYSLCRKYGISEVDFYSINPKVKQGKPLKLGQEILFPYTVLDDKNNEPEKDTINFYYHLIEKGETVYAITRTYQVTKEELVKVNPDFDGIKLLVGDVLKIPKKKGVVLVDNNQVIDSIAKVNFVEDDTVFSADKFCDQKNWFTNGKNFEVVLLLPFEISSNMRNLYNQATANRDQRLFLTTEKIISFYSGCLIALDNFKSFDTKINFKVYDIGKDNSVLAKLIEDGKLSGADMIIGPAFKSQLEFLNANLANSQAPVLIPFVNDSEFLEKHDYNIMLNPSTDDIIEGVASYAALNPSYKYFIIKGNTPEQTRLAEKYLAAINEKLDSVNVSLINFGGKDLAGVKNVVDKNRENVFIMPFNTETSATNIFLDLFPLKDHEITLIGDKSVLDYETIDPTYYSRVKFTYFSGNQVIYSDEKTKQFVSVYRDVFKCEPDDYAFLAYDAISFHLLKLLRHGNKCCSCIEKDNTYKGISGLKCYKSGSNFAESSFSNSTVYIYTIQEDYSFKLVFPIAE